MASIGDVSLDSVCAARGAASVLFWGGVEGLFVTSIKIIALVFLGGRGVVRHFY